MDMLMMLKAKILIRRRRRRRGQVVWGRKGLIKMMRRGDLRVMRRMEIISEADFLGVIVEIFIDTRGRSHARRGQ
jgi:hypothetical protein